MAPIPNSEMLDDLAVSAMDLQVAMAEEPNKSKHPELIRKTIEQNCKKFAAIPDFEEGKLQLNTFISYLMELNLLLQDSTGLTCPNR